MSIQPTAIYPPGQPPPVTPYIPPAGYQYTYNTRTIPNQNPGPSGQFATPNWMMRIYGAAPSPVTYNMPGGVPKFLGSNQILFGAWIVAMAFVSFDEWHNNGILPRPARLWYTSLLFGILAVASVFQAALPLINIFAIGIVINLVYDYYTNNGQFSSSGNGTSNSGAGLNETSGT